ALARLTRWTTARMPFETGRVFYEIPPLNGDGYRAISRAAIGNALQAARASRVCAATFREAAQRCRRRRQGLERLRRGRPTSRGRAYRSASDGPSHSWQLPECTTRPARLRRRRERGRYPLRCASLVRRGR